MYGLCMAYVWLYLSVLILDRIWVGYIIYGGFQHE